MHLGGFLEVIYLYARFYEGRSLENKGIGTWGLGPRAKGFLGIVYIQPYTLQFQIKNKEKKYK